MQKMLGVRIDTLTKNNILKTASRWLDQDDTHSIYTPNPEMLVETARNETFRDILNRGDLNVCDGFGIQLMSRGKIKRFPGVDLMLTLCELAERVGKSVYLLGGLPDVAKHTGEVLQKRFPRLNIKGVQTGPDITIERLNNRTMWKIDDEKMHDEMIADIVLAKPDILFVAFGHGKQEWWIDTFQKELPGVNILMGVGGSFDMIAGKIARAPKVFRAIGMEWLWRLIKEPRRIKRIFTATIIFPLLVFKSYVTK